MPEKYDVIVVGAGNGGLVAAATTAKAGLKTLLIEKHNLPGGSATSFRRGRFEFEPSLHEMAGYGSSEDPGDLRELFDSLGVNLELVAIKDAYRIIDTSNGLDVTMPAGRDNYIAKMEETVPGSKESMLKYFELTDDCIRALDYLTLMKGNPDLGVLMGEHAHFMKLANATLQEVLDLIEMPKLAQQVLTNYWSYLGSPTEMCDFFIYAIMLDRYLRYHAYIPKDRSHEMSLAIEKVIRDGGGDIWYNCPVTRILIEDGVAKGVATEFGEVYADQIISNVIPHKIFGVMADSAAVPEAELKRANARTIGCSAFCVYIGLNKSPEELGITDYSVFISDSDDSNKQFEQMGSLEDNNFMVMNCLNNGNPGCSPEGTSMLWVTQLYNGDSWCDIKPEDYKKVKNDIAKKTIKIYEETLGIKISDCIEEISVATPVTFARYLGTPKGTIYGYQNQMWDTMLARTMNRVPEETIKGLIFCGGHSFMIHGYSSTYKSGSRAGSQAVAALAAMRGEQL
ncbi:MAG: NAD(P)/FAD-dependent oxidoreductase [Coriobacteriales bacterium]|jgi:prolycopene isomerase|nr:NAD(P)/FAD-dependent oxidoreductase [Coriobacteriales bacterium]